jgi:LysM repeat protein
MLSDTLFLAQKHFEYINEIRKIRYYVVRKGDTLGKIALKSGVSISQLCRLNNIKRTTLLKIGRRLRYT